MNFYYYLYHGFYKFLRRTHYKDIAGYMACVAFSFFLGINIMVIVKYIGIEPLKALSKFTYAIIIFGPLLILNVLVFVLNKRYKSIDEKVGPSGMSGTVALLYALVTIALLLVL
ncbi:hypothetical protein [Fulvivirga imtechensis]|uniref:hypothetical protein n=1 Tax=Fulvivirga imtechensis TaxID=881893 RepID=UPI00058ADED5|nr:hypothetical protein [Fulvivirga imtechensis]